MRVFNSSSLDIILSLLLHSHCSHCNCNSLLGFSSQRKSTATYWDVAAYDTYADPYIVPDRVQLGFVFSREVSNQSKNTIHTIQSNDAGHDLSQS